MRRDRGLNEKELRQENQLFCGANGPNRATLDRIQWREKELIAPKMIRFDRAKPRAAQGSQCPRPPALDREDLIKMSEPQQRAQLLAYVYSKVKDSLLAN